MKMFFDFDEVIVDTIKAIVNVYIEDFKLDQDYIKPNLNKLYSWRMLDIFPLANEKWIKGIFARQIFFDYLKLKDGILELIQKLIDDNHEIIICTKGSNNNISLKSLFIDDHFPKIETIYMNITDKKETGKGLIDMSEAIFIDDNQDNLISSNATYKILFAEYGSDKEWNEKWNGMIVNDVDDLKNAINIWLDYEDALND